MPSLNNLIQSELKVQKLIAQIETEQDFEKRLKIYQRFTSLLQTPGRMRINPSFGFFCFCNKCKSKNKDFDQQEQIYLKHYIAEVENLDKKIKNKSYFNKLQILFKNFGFTIFRTGPLDFSLGNFKREIKVAPETSEEIEIYNKFLYEKHSDRSNYTSEKTIDNFLSRYPNFLFKEKSTEKEINDIIEEYEKLGTNDLWNSLGKKTFNSLMKGVNLNFGGNPWDQLEVIQIHKANELFKYITFLQNFLLEKKQKDNFITFGEKKSDDKPENERIIEKFEDLFYNQVDIKMCFEALIKVSPPIINIHGDYILGRKQKGAIVAWIEVLLYYKGKIRQFHAYKHVSLLNKFIPGLNISYKSFENKGTSSYNFYLNDFLALIN